MAIEGNNNYYYQKNQIDKKIKNMEIKARIKNRTVLMYLIISTLLISSLLNMFSATFSEIYKNSLSGVKGHFLYMIIGMVILVFTMKIDYRVYNSKRLVNLLAVISILSILGVVFGSKVPSLRGVIPRVNGAIGWVRIAGFSIQPSEIIKIFYIIILANRFEIVERERKKDLGVILYTIIPVATAFFLITLQEDLGSAIHYVAIYIFMLFLSKIDGKKIVAVVIAGISVAVSSFYYISKIENIADKGYKIRRIGSYINGLLYGEYDNSVGYQVGQALIAFGNGGIDGVGFGNGVQKYSYIPEIRTDFISTCFGEEFGFIGIVIIFACFFALFSLIRQIAVDTQDYFGRYLAMGIGGYIMTQVFINIFVALGLLPVFGIPMPLFSYGGTSIVTVLVSLGIVMSINRNGRRKEIG